MSAAKVEAPNSMRKYYPLIDLFKFVFASFVVMVHTEFLNPFIPDERTRFVFSALTLRLAGPFFFIVYGFFLRAKLNNNNSPSDIFLSRAKALFPPLIVWSFISLPFDINRYCAGYPLGKKIFYIVKTILFYPSGYMWFLWSCIIWTAFICLLWKVKGKHIIYAVMCCLTFLVHMLCNSYFFFTDFSPYLAKFVRLYDKFFISERVPVGLTYILLGFVVYEIYSRIKNAEKAKIVSIIILFISFVLCFFEASFLYDKKIRYSKETFFSLLIIVPALVLLLLLFSENIKKDFSAVRKLSTGVYYSQSFVLEIVSLFLHNNILLFFVVMIITIIISLIFRRFRLTSRLV